MNIYTKTINKFLKKKKDKNRENDDIVNMCAPKTKKKKEKSSRGSFILPSNPQHLFWRGRELSSYIIHISALNFIPCHI